MSWGIEKERRTVWRVTTAEGDSMVFNNKEEAVNRLKKELNTVRVKVALAQQSVSCAHKACSNAMRTYKDFLVRKVVELEVSGFSSSSCSVAWRCYGRPDTHHCFIQQSAEFVKGMSKGLLREYVRHCLKYQLQRDVKILKEEKRKYYETVKFSKMARDFRFEED